MAIRRLTRKRFIGCTHRFNQFYSRAEHTTRALILPLHRSKPFGNIVAGSFRPMPFVEGIESRSRWVLGGLPVFSKPLVARPSHRSSLPDHCPSARGRFQCFHKLITLRKKHTNAPSPAAQPAENLTFVAASMHADPSMAALV